jgi:hypothetical protein
VSHLSLVSNIKLRFAVRVEIRSDNLLLSSKGKSTSTPVLINFAAEYIATRSVDTQLSDEFFPEAKQIWAIFT